MVFYELEIKVEELRDGGDYRYLATSPDLPGLMVAGDTAEEVLSLAPQVASALITSMKAAGDPIPDTLRATSSLLAARSKPSSSGASPVQCTPGDGGAERKADG